MSFHIAEHFALEATPGTEENVRRVRLISPGKGSSGIYSEELLARDVHKALPQGTLVYLDHTDADDKRRRGGTRSTKDVAGKFVSDPVYERDNPLGAGSYVDVKFLRTVMPLVEDIGDAIGVSVEIYTGRKDNKNNIVEMGYHPLNALALVPVPGRDGRIVEGFRDDSDEPQEEGTDMPISEEDRKAIVTDVLAGLTEALKPEPVEEAALDVPGLVEAIRAASLPAVLVRPVVEAVMAGTAVDEAVSSQVALVESIREGIAAEGVLSEDGDGGDVATLQEQYNELLNRRFGGKK